MRKLLPRKTAYAILLLVMAAVAAGFLAMLVLVDSFPLKLTMALIGMLLVFLVLARGLLGSKSKAGRIAGIVLAVVFLATYGLGIYYLTATYSMYARISVDDGSGSSIDVTKEPFNLYITGIDQWESEKGKDAERSDVNMIVTVNPNTRTILLTSIPRDTFVPLARNGKMDKLTHTGVYGVDETLATVEKWLGIDMDYYLKMNFTAVVDIINAMDGVDVYSDKEFKPTKRDWWTVKKGWNHMNGKQALAFARERHAYEGKDSRRVENQQKVVKACIKKMTESPILLTRYTQILSAASRNMEVSMPRSTMQALIKAQLADMGKWRIISQKVKGEYGSDYVYSLSQKKRYTVYKVDAFEKNRIVNKIGQVMYPSDKEINKAEKNSKEESMKNFGQDVQDSAESVKETVKEKVAE